MITVKAVADKRAEIRVYGEIGEGFFAEGTTAKTVRNQLDQVDITDIDMFVNSPGGNVWEGLAIANILAAHPAQVHAHVEGLAASAASVITSAADLVTMGAGSMMMVHSPWALFSGNAEELRGMASVLDKVEAGMLDIYEARTGKPRDELEALLRSETWMTAQEAVDGGFADDLAAEKASKTAAWVGSDAVMACFQHTPHEVMAMAKRNKSCGIHAGANLARRLDSAIESMESDERSRADIIEEMAQAADISAGTVNQILNGEINCPPVERLQGFASVLEGVTASALITAAESDGCEYDDDDDDDEQSATADAITGKEFKMVTKARAPVQATGKEIAEQARVAERERVKAISATCSKFDMDAEFISKQIDDGTSVDEVNAAILDKLEAETKGKQPAHPDDIDITVDERDKWLAGAQSWLVVKSGNARLIESHTKERPLPGEFRGLRLIDLASQSLVRAGVDLRGKTPMEIARLAVMPQASAASLGTRSDFPVLLENTLHKLLLAAYETAPDKWRQIATTGAVQDFRDHPRYRVGSLPRLDTLLESGEFKSLHFPDAQKETIKAGTFGNLIGLTRQAIVNDDLDGFARLITMLGRAAARSIEIDLFALFGLNSGLGPTMNDAKTLFHADHNNIAGTAGTPGTATLEAARVLMASQKDQDDNDFLDLSPDVWTGPIGLGSAVRSAISAEFDFDAGGSSPKFMKPNTVRDLLSTVVDTPRLAGTRWYVLADPGIAPVFEVVFLQGQESPQIETQESFEFDGVRWRVRHDYGVGATDWRGAVTNAGA